MALKTTGETMVVTGEQVQEYTREGWRLVFVVQEICRFAVLRQVPYTEAEIQSYASYRGQTKSVSMDEVGTVTRYVLERDEASALSVAQQALVDAQRQHGDQQEQITVLTRKAAEDEPALHKAAARISDLETRLSTGSADNQRLNASNRKLERDLGRVREAVGALRMKEILGE